MTTEGETRPLGPPFLVLATQNPIEYEGTYPLPEAQLDRFLLRMSVGYPSARGRVAGARRTAPSAARDEVELDAGRRPRDAARDAAGVRGASTSRSRSASTWSTSSRRRATPQSIQVGASPRGSLALLKLSRCRAALDGPRLRDARRREGGRRAGARAPADAAPGALGAARSRPRTSCASGSTRCRRRPPKTSRRAVTRYATAEARGVRGALGGRAARRARHRPPRARRADGAVPARARPRARARRRRRG